MRAQRQTFSLSTRVFGVVALCDDRGFVVSGRVWVGVRDQGGAGSAGIHGRPFSAPPRMVIMLRPCLAAVERTPRIV
jgi:hypothetical protein